MIASYYNGNWCFDQLESIHIAFYEDQDFFSYSVVNTLPVFSVKILMAKINNKGTLLLTQQLRIWILACMIFFLHNLICKGFI